MRACMCANCLVEVPLTSPSQMPQALPCTGGTHSDSPKYVEPLLLDAPPKSKYNFQISEFNKNLLWIQASGIVCSEFVWGTLLRLERKAWSANASTRSSPTNWQCILILRLVNANGGIPRKVPGSFAELAIAVNDVGWDGELWPLLAFINLLFIHYRAATGERRIVSAMMMRPTLYCTWASLSQRND